jgi:hypothetical protein
MKYMILSDTGLPAFYSEDIHGPLTIDGEPNPAYPAGGTEISDDQWMLFLEKQPNIKWDEPSKSFVAYSPPPPPAAVPETISDRQFFQQLAIEGKITQDEALAAVQTGVLPAAIATLVAKLPTDQQFAARMLLCGATSFQRSSAIVPVLAQLYGMSAAALDALWTAAAAL